MKSICYFAAVCIAATAQAQYPSIQVEVDGTVQDLYVQYPSWSSAQSTGTDLSYDYNNRMYLSTVPSLDTSQYFEADLLGGVLDYDVDLSLVGCSCITALYTVLMPGIDNSSDPFQYCDANQVGGHWCPEFDIMEANKYAFHVTGHKCDAPDSQGVYSNCDRGGQCTVDFLTNSDPNDYGPSSSNTINTLLPFHVNTKFHEDGGQFVGYTTTLTQEGREVVETTGNCSYLNYMSSDMQRMVIVFSNWSSNSLNWLQHGVCSGSCNQSTNSQTFSNLKIQTTGAGPVPGGVTPPSPSPEPTDFEWGGDCNNLNDQECGLVDCAQCTWSWPAGDPDQWNSSNAACRCQVENEVAPPEPEPPAPEPPAPEPEPPAPEPPAPTPDPIDQTVYKYSRPCGNNLDQSLCSDGCPCFKSWPADDPDNWQSVDAACRCLPKQRAPEGYIYKRPCKDKSNGTCNGCASCSWSYPNDDPERWRSAEAMCRCVPDSPAPAYQYGGDCGNLYDDDCGADCSQCRWSWLAGSNGAQTDQGCRCNPGSIVEIEFGDNCNNLTDGLCGSYCRECRFSWEATDADKWLGDTKECRCRNWW